MLKNLQACFIIFQQRLYGGKLETKDQIKKESRRSASLTNKQRTHDDKICDECATKIFLPIYPIQNRQYSGGALPGVRIS